MTVLALDSCRRGWLVALAQATDGTVIDRVEIQGSLAINIPSVITRLMRHDPSAIVVVTGPGSYTGIRAGIAAAIAVSSARGIPVYGSDKLTAVASLSDAPRVCAVVDAGRGGAYMRIFEREKAGPMKSDHEPFHVTRDLCSPPGCVVIGDMDVTAIEILRAAILIALAGNPLNPASITPTYVLGPRIS